MLVAVWVGAALAQDRPVAAVLRSADRDDLGVTSLSPSSDGSLLLAYGPEHAVVLGAADGERRAAVELQRVELGVVAKNGRFALVHEGGITMHAADGREELRLGGFGRVMTIALSPDARWLAIGSTLTLEVHDAMDGRLLWSKEGATASVGFSPDGGAVLAERGGAPVAFDVAKGKTITSAATLTPPAGFRPQGCSADDGGGCPVPGAPAFEHDDHLLLVVGGRVETWRLLFGEQVTTVALDAPPAAASWAGADLVVGLADGRVGRMGPDGGGRLDVVPPGCEGGCAFLGVGGSDSETWAAGPGGLQRWDGSGAPLVKKPKRLDAVALLHGAGGWVALGTDGRVRVGEAPGDGKPSAALPGATGVDAAGTTVAAWGPDGLLLAGTDGSERPSPSLGPGRRPSSVALSPDGAKVAVIDDQGALHLYRTLDAHADYRLPLGLAGGALAWSSDASRILTGGDTVRVFAAEDGAEIAGLTLGEPVVGLAVSTSGRLLVRSAGAVRTLDTSLVE